MTREQLLDLLRDAQDFIYHSETCEVEANWHVGVQCTCGMRRLMVRVEDALANHPERPESSSKSLPRRAIKVVNTGKDDGDDDGS